MSASVDCRAGLRSAYVENGEEKMERRKIHFTMEKDIQLLSETIIHNPFAYGSDKWANVSCNLREKYDLEVVPRTARERVNNLLTKLRKDDLSPRTATKKEIDERKRLILQVRALMEENETSSAISGSEEKKPHMMDTPVSLEQEEFFQVFVDEKDIDWPTSQNQRKRPATIEEYLRIKRQEMDHELNILRLKNDNEQKIKELELQAERDKAETEYKFQSLNIERQRLEAESENKKLLTSVIELVTMLSGKISNKADNEIMFN